MTIVAIRQGLIELRQAMHEIHDGIAEVNFVLSKNSASEDERRLAIASLANQLVAFRSLDESYIAINRELNALSDKFTGLLVNVLEIQQGEETAKNVLAAAEDVASRNANVRIQLPPMTPEDERNGKGGVPSNGNGNGKKTG